MKFKKGDKVRALTDIDCIDGTVIAGTEGIVESDEGVGYIVKFDGDKARYGRWCDPYEIEVITEDER